MKMKVLAGNLYFISDDFFTKIQDPYLKKNYEKTKRPHYFAIKDNKTKLYWLVPCSSKVEKFEHLIQKKQEQHKSTDAIKIVKIFNVKTVLLFQDMFPIIMQYIDGQYIKGGQPVRIADSKLIQELEKNAKKIINLLHRGVRFTPTQPTNFLFLLTGDIYLRTILFIFTKSEHFPIELKAGQKPASSLILK